VLPAPIQDLRDLTRYRAELRQSQTRVANRMQKLLEQANLKLSSVATGYRVDHVIQVSNLYGCYDSNDTPTGVAAFARALAAPSCVGEYYTCIGHCGPPTGTAMA